MAREVAQKEFLYEFLVRTEWAEATPASSGALAAYENYYCHACGNYRHDGGHAPDCPLAVILTELGAELDADNHLGRGYRAHYSDYQKEETMPWEGWFGQRGARAWFRRPEQSTGSH